MSVTLDQDNVLWLKVQFDALISAAARDLELPLVKRDADIGSSGAVRTIW